MKLGLKSGRAGKCLMSCVIEYRSTKGLTMIELMVAVVMVAVTFTLAVPVYAGLRIRTEASECVNHAAPTRLAGSELCQTHGEQAPSLEVALAINNGTCPYCNTASSDQKASGAFTIDVNEPALDLKLVKVSPKFVPSINNAKVTNWSCSSGKRILKNSLYLPASCRDD